MTYFDYPCQSSYVNCPQLTSLLKGHPLRLVGQAARGQRGEMVGGKSGDITESLIPRVGR